MLKTKVLVPLVAALGFAAVPAMSATVSTTRSRLLRPRCRSRRCRRRRRHDLVPGYYDYRDGQYAWTPGHFEAVREGYVYVAPVYREGRYYTGRWARAGEEEHGGARNKIREAKNKVKDRIKNGDKDDQ